MSAPKDIDAAIEAAEEAAAKRRTAGDVSSVSISAGGGSKSISYVSGSEGRAEIEALRRRKAVLTRGGSAARCFYPFGGGGM